MRSLDHGKGIQRAAGRRSVASLDADPGKADRLEGLQTPRLTTFERVFPCRLAAIREPAPCECSDVQVDDLQRVFPCRLAAIREAPPRECSHVEVDHLERVVLDELAPGLDHVAHQGLEDLARLVRRARS